MGAGTIKGNGTRFGVNFIDKYPITLNMTFKHPLIVAMKRVIMAFANFVGGGKGCSLMIIFITLRSLSTAIPRFCINLYCFLKVFG
jgi:hypothetical protein